MPIPRERELLARIAAFERWARTTDRTAQTAPARAAFMSRFDSEPDPVAARKAYFGKLALKSSRSRAARAAHRDGGGGDAA